MKGFEQELKDIIGPISPDPPVQWGYLTIVATVSLLVVIGYFTYKKYGRSLLKKVLKKTEKKPLSRLQRVLLSYEKNGAQPEELDFDQCWNILVEVFDENELISHRKLTLFEMGKLFKTNKLLNLEHRELFSELIQQMESHKYEKSFSSENRTRLVDCFREAAQILEKI